MNARNLKNKILHPVLTFVRSYPLPIFTLFGILLGLILQFGFLQVEASHWIWFATLTLGGIPIIYQTIKGMLHGQFASDIVAMLAIVTAILTQQAFAGAVVVLMQSGGEAIEFYGLRRASFSLTALLQRAPRIARRQKEQRIEEVDVSQVEVDDLLIVRPGDLVPVDGIIVEGSAEIDESALTGEPLARGKTVGDRLLSGSIDVNGAIIMKATNTSEKSQYSKIVKLVQKAQEEKAPIQRLADRYAVFFTPLTLFIAACGFWLTGDITTVLAVLVVATPCPLILATPLAVICGINKAADLGIIVKGGGAMEQIASVKAVLFDKTGTITFGSPVIEKIIALSDISENELLYYAAIIEQFSGHSIAAAIVEKAMQIWKSLPRPHSFREIPGQGVAGEINGASYLIGSYAFLEQQIGQENRFKHYEEEGKNVVFLLKNQVCIGCFILNDQMRPGAAQLVDKLYGLGIQDIMMITGDSKGNAQRIAAQSGIKQYEAALLPAQKVNIVHQKSQSYGAVMMVGDGINDAPALATATVGVAMGAHGNAISAESANIVLLVDDIDKIAEAIVIGRQMLCIAKQSIFIGIGLSFVLMLIAVFGYISPPVGAMLQEVIDVAVILNALRAR